MEYGTRQESNPTVARFGRVLMCVVLLGATGGVPGSLSAQQAFTVNTVSDDGDHNPGDGVCGTGPSATYCSLRAAIEEANASGIETDVSVPTTAVIYVTSGPLVVEADISINGLGMDTTVISNGLFNQVFEVEPAGDLSLSNLEVKLGWTTGSGGNISVDRGSLSLQSCRVTGGLAAGHGGGIMLYSGASAIIISSVISGNETNGSGGAIYAVATSGTPSLQIISSRLQDNEAGGGGGAVYMTDGTLVIDESELTGNTAEVDGGGIALVKTLNAWNGTLSITATTVSDNSGRNGGGLYYYIPDGGGLAIDSSTFQGNSAATQGGGIYSYLEDPDGITIVNSTISGNQADLDAGGILFYGGDPGQDLELSSCTVTDNTADTDASDTGGAGGLFSFGSGAIVMRNTVVAGNHDLSPNSAVDPDCFGDLKSDGYNFIGVVNSACNVFGDTSGNQTGIPGSPLDPMLGPLTAGWSTKVHPLLDGSPAIDAGNPSGCRDHDGATIWEDQRLETRHFGPACDVGSYEFQGTSSLIFADGFESGSTSGWS